MGKVIPIREEFGQSLAEFDQQGSTSSVQVQHSELHYAAYRPVRIIILSRSAAYQSNAPLWWKLKLNSVIHVSTQQELLELLKGIEVDFVLLDLEYAEQAGFSDQIKKAQAATQIIFITDEQRSPVLLKTAYRGHQFFSLPAQGEPKILAKAFLEQVFPRRELRHRCDNVYVDFCTKKNGIPVKWRRMLFDISSSGFSWLAKKKDLGGAFLPGTAIYDLKVSSNNKTLLEVERAYVQHFTPYDDVSGQILTSCYKVGVRLSAVSSNKSAELLEEKLVRDPVEIIALLKQGLESETLHVIQMDNESQIYTAAWQNKGGFPTESFLLKGDWPEDWQAGTVVKVTFELASWGYELLTSIEEFNNKKIIKLRLPSSLKATKKRSVVRHLLPVNSTLKMQCPLPFLNKNVTIKPTDISTRGLSIEIPASVASIPAGSYLARMRLIGLKDRLIYCKGLIRSVFLLHRENVAYYRYGIEISDIASQDLFTLTDNLVGDVVQGIEGIAEGLSFDALWAFLYKSNFIYPEKAESLKPILPEVKRNLSGLLKDANSPVLHTMVARSKDRNDIQGHVSFVHIYTNTWMVQHMAAIRDGEGSRHAARSIQLGVTNALHQLKNMHWWRVYYQAEKKFSEKMFTHFASRVKDPAYSCTSTYAYLVSRDLHIDKRRLPLQVRLATAHDFQQIEAYFVDRNILIEFLAEDGFVDEMSLDTINTEYHTVKLSRKRQIVVVEKAGRVCGVALIELSSLGLNLSELTNKCKIHVWDEEPCAVLSLAKYAQSVYLQQGYPFCIVMVAAQHIPVLATIGFTHQRNYICWTLHRDLFPDYANYLDKGSEI